jgi:hypothetical protein
MDRGEVIATFNELIATCRDGEEGFRTCAEAVKNPQLKSFFEGSFAGRSHFRGVHARAALPLKAVGQLIGLEE